jgi:hypothetical protein
MSAFTGFTAGGAHLRLLSALHRPAPRRTGPRPGRARPGRAGPRQGASGDPGSPDSSAMVARAQSRLAW